LRAGGEDEAEIRAILRELYIAGAAEEALANVV
jgi:hypothetical protein